jgi:hypothetical protein
MSDDEKITPEDLKEPVRKLLSLLDDPQPGMFTWWEFLNDRMIEVHGLLDRALKKSGIIK